MSQDSPLNEFPQEVKNIYNRLDGTEGGQKIKARLAEGRQKYINLQQLLITSIKSPSLRLPYLPYFTKYQSPQEIKDTQSEITQKLISMQLLFCLRNQVKDQQSLTQCTKMVSNLIHQGNNFYRLIHKPYVYSTPEEE